MIILIDMNESGFTWKEWLAAATVGAHKQDVQRRVEAMKVAWKADEDCSEWRRAFEIMRNSRKVKDASKPKKSYKRRYHRGVTVNDSPSTKRVAIPTGRHKGVFTLARNLTAEQITEVRERAVRHSNHELMRICDRALKGSHRARVAIARLKIEGRAASR